MTRDHEGESDCLVQPSQDMPQQVSRHDVVLILTPTVVRMEVDIMPMHFKEHAHNGIRPLTHIYIFVDDIVDLTGNCLTAHTEDGTLSRSEEVHGSGLQGSFG